jgi:hypothetical protein
MSFLRTPRASTVTNHESCERSSSREENDPVHSFATPTKTKPKTKTKTVRPVLHDLHKMERKADKKKRYAESALWKRRHHKEFQRNRDRKYTEPLDEPLDFSAESFSDELSSREAHEVEVTHTFKIRHREISIGRIKGTLYCTPHSVFHYGYSRNRTSSDDIFILKSIDNGWDNAAVHEVHRGDWGTLSHDLMDRCQYGSGCYELSVK